MLLYKNIFYIEDDEDDQMFFMEAIKDIGSSITCTFANDGREALDKLKTFLQLPDLIFLDINMPRMNGIEFLSRLKAENSLKEIPVAVLSTASNESEKIYKLGANIFITKPDTLSQLSSKLKDVLNDGFNNE